MADTAPAEEAPSAPQKPADPRRAPDVVLALAQAGKRDPHPDPFKPLGRVSFLIWMAMIATLYFAGGQIGRAVNLPALQHDTLSLAQGFAGTDRERERAWRKVERSEHSMEIAAVTGFAGGTLLFAVYYFAVYLVGMNLRRLMMDAAATVQSGAQRVGAWYARHKARSAALKEKTRVRQTGAGPEPQVH